MLDWFTIMLILLGMLFTFYAIQMIRENDYFWSFILTLISTVIWYILAAGIMEVETTYEMYNATSGNIETGIHTSSSKIAPSMVYFFYMLASVTFLLNVTILFMGLWDAIKKRRRG